MDTTGTRVTEIIDRRGRETIITYSCPGCGLILFSKPNYCSRCGIRLIWPDGLDRGLYR